VNDPSEQPSFLTMVGLVAAIVAIVILVFFGIGYLFGRVFL
jgi:type IV secretory pathway VirB2 component (pilin)